MGGYDRGGAQPGVIIDITEKEKVQLDKYREKIFAEIETAKGRLAQLERESRDVQADMKAKREAVEQAIGLANDRLSIAVSAATEAEARVPAANAAYAAAHEAIAFEKAEWEKQLAADRAIRAKEAAASQSKFDAVAQQVSEKSELLALLATDYSTLKAAIVELEKSSQALQDKNLAQLIKQDEIVANTRRAQVELTHTEDAIQAARSSIEALDVALAGKRLELLELNNQLASLAGAIKKVSDDQAFLVAKEAQLADFERDLKVQELSLSNRKAVVTKRENALREAQQQTLKQGD